MFQFTLSFIWFFGSLGLFIFFGYKIYQKFISDYKENQKIIQRELAAIDEKYGYKWNETE